MPIHSPNKYKSELRSLIKVFNSYLDEMTKLYPNYKLNINTNLYLKDKENFNSVKSDIDKLESFLSQDVEDNRKKIMNLNNKISELNKKNNELTKEYNSLNNQGLAAKGELVDQKFIGKETYTQNIILLLIILSTISGYFIKTFKII